MTNKVNTENATVNVLLEINGQIHLVGMSQDKVDAVSFLVKRAVEAVIPTKKTQGQLNDFLGYKG